MILLHEVGSSPRIDLIIRHILRAAMYREGESVRQKCDLTAAKQLQVEFSQRARSEIPIRSKLGPLQSLADHTVMPHLMDAAFPIQGISSQRLAIFGGSFDPVHCGHLNMAQQAQQQVGLAQILWLPAANPPHKSGRVTTPVAHRLAMLELALASKLNQTISTLEVQRPGLSFAAQTFRQLRQSQPQADWHWLIGSDTFASLPRWYDLEELVEHCHWLVVPRAGSRPLQTLIAQVQQQLTTRELPLRWSVLNLKPLAVSSTQIREAVAQGTSIAGLVPAAVQAYIEAHGLYRD
ncbi:nicotinate (nicotinamide) nucleotide adenylyltransferase [Leptolyngbya sp. FACHB-261]|nr:nicotinate (nicotinamide) nucleotide adenylyltransferase [Leptolyngbya sp. FACHB-261]